MRFAFFAISKPHRKLPATGRRIYGSTDVLTGAASRWTKPRSPFCCSISSAAKRLNALGKLERWWPMVRKAASFILRNGPVTQQDRWEEDAGYSPFTLAAEISALLAAADIAELTGPRRSSAHHARCRRCLERQHRTLGLRHRRRLGGSTGHCRLLRSHCPTRHRRRGVAHARLRSHQEPPPGPGEGARLPHHQPGRACAGALWPARSR